MPLREPERPRRLVAWTLALGLLGWSGPAAADLLVHYAIDASTSVVHTAGGLDGTGIGDLAISGTFDLFVDDQTSSAVFQNVDVTTAPGSGFVFPGYESFDVLDAIGTSLFRGTQTNPLGLPDDTYDATLGTVSHELDIIGVYYEPVLDGFVYDYEIHTTIVPEPSTLSLWSAALIVLVIPAAGIRGWTVPSPQA